MSVQTWPCSETFIYANVIKETPCDLVGRPSIGIAAVNRQPHCEHRDRSSPLCSLYKRRVVAQLFFFFSPQRPNFHGHTLSCPSSAMFTHSALPLAIVAMAAQALGNSYTRSSSISGSGFYDAFAFQNITDPTSGRVYVPYPFFLTLKLG